MLFKNLSFKYNQLENDVLKDITLTIPRGKVTAIGWLSAAESGEKKKWRVAPIFSFWRAPLAFSRCWAPSGLLCFMAAAFAVPNWGAEPPVGASCEAKRSMAHQRSG